MYEIAKLASIRMVADTIATLDQSLPSQYYDWDDYAEEYELPDVDCIGLIGFACAQSGRFHDIVAGVGICTLNDNGLYRMTKIVNTFYERLKAESRFDAFTPEGVKCGVVTCFDGTAVSPIGRVKVRPAQSIQFSARLVLGGV